jgi:nicotinate-nucleotide--dimethylbenzimidazole phosphoribosyltransferase
MISTPVRSAIDNIRPLLDRNLAGDILRNWASQPKQPASLGRLEDIVVHFGIVRGQADPVLRRSGLYVFAADHGIVMEGITAEAQDQTTRQCVRFLQGLSPAQVLCRQARIEPFLVNVGVRSGDLPGALNGRLGDGSLNMATGPAMTVETANAALELGIRMAEDAATRFDIVGLGQLGIGGSAAASAILSAMTGRDALDTVNRLPGLDDATYSRRVSAVRSAVARNQPELISPFGVLRSLSGLDIAAMTGFLLGAAANRLPVMIDGYTAGAAAMLARGLAADSLDAFLFSHLQPERCHSLMLHFLSVEPLLDLHIEETGGFGAALGIQMLETSLALFRENRQSAPPR